MRQCNRLEWCTGWWARVDHCTAATVTQSESEPRCPARSALGARASRYARSRTAPRGSARRGEARRGDVSSRAATRPPPGGETTRTRRRRHGLSLSDTDSSVGGASRCCGAAQTIASEKVATVLTMPSHVLLHSNHGTGRRRDAGHQLSSCTSAPNRPCVTHCQAVSAPQPAPSRWRLPWPP